LVAKSSLADRQVLRQVALTSGPSLEDQQLTADDVPVLVETCIKFIEA